MSNNTYLSIDANGMSKLESNSIYITENYETKTPPRRESTKDWLTRKMSLNTTKLSISSISNSSPTINESKSKKVDAGAYASSDELQPHQRKNTIPLSSSQHVRRPSSKPSTLILEEEDTLSLSSAPEMRPRSSSCSTNGKHKTVVDSKLTGSSKVTTPTEVKVEIEEMDYVEFLNGPTPKKAELSFIEFLKMEPPPDNKGNNNTSLPNLPQKDNISLSALKKKMSFSGSLKLDLNEKTNINPGNSASSINQLGGSNPSLSIFPSNMVNSPTASTVNFTAIKFKMSNLKYEKKSGLFVKIVLTVDNGVLSVSEEEEDSIDEVENNNQNLKQILKLQLGSLVSLINENDTENFGFIVVSADSKVYKFQAINEELMIKTVCVINTANSNEAYTKSLQVTNDQTKQYQNLEVYRNECKTLLERLGIKNLAEFTEDSSIEQEYQEFQQRFLIDETELISKMDQKFSNTEALIKSPSTNDIIRYEIGDKEKFLVCGATIEKLVERLSDEHGPDEEFCNIFLNTFRHFTSSEAFFDSLLNRLQTVNKEDNTDIEKENYQFRWRSIFKLRLILVFEKWLKNYWEVDFGFDFDEKNFMKNKKLAYQISKFLHLISVNPTDCTNKKYSQQDLMIFIPDLKFLKKSLKILILKFLRCDYKKSQESLEDLQTTLINLPPPKDEYNPLIFLEFESETVGKHLTLIQFNRLSQIKLIDILLNLWGDKSDLKIIKETSNLNDAINGFNIFSYWVPTTICTQPDIKIRVKVIEKFIKIAKSLQMMRNYETSFAIFSGLNVSSVTRLKNTWEIVDSKKKKTLNELEIFYNPQMNYRSYRQALEQIYLENEETLANTNESAGNGAVTIQPFIPIISVFLKDLTFMNDGNKKYLQENNQNKQQCMINFYKLKLIYQNCLKFLEFQSNNSVFNNNGNTSSNEINKILFDFCNNLRSLSNKEQVLHKYSLICEPKHDTQSSLALKWEEEAKK
ncbi:hypothetical protein HDU92_001915 [Lobulomyces angularis]|nr:hypothetical protein HDU92_001915 [Lobulomyces angularis]